MAVLNTSLTWGQKVSYMVYFLGINQMRTLNRGLQFRKIKLF